MRRTLAVLIAGVVTAGTGIAAEVSLVAASAAATASPATTHTTKTIPTPPALVTPNAWTLGSLPPPTFRGTSGQISAVTCATASFCVAVGNETAPVVGVETVP